MLQMIIEIFYYYLILFYWFHLCYIDTWKCWKGRKQSPHYWCRLILCNFDGEREFSIIKNFWNVTWIGYFFLASQCAKMSHNNFLYLFSFSTAASGITFRFYFSFTTIQNLNSKYVSFTVVSIFAYIPVQSIWAVILKRN